MHSFSQIGEGIIFRGKRKGKIGDMKKTPTKTQIAIMMTGIGLGMTVEVGPKDKSAETDNQPEKNMLKSH